MRASNARLRESHDGGLCERSLWMAKIDPVHKFDVYHINTGCHRPGFAVSSPEALLPLSLKRPPTERPSGDVFSPLTLSHFCHKTPGFIFGGGGGGF